MGKIHGQMAADQPTFGPVPAVVRVDGAADAVHHVNTARYGLGASIWTRDEARARDEGLARGAVDAVDTIEPRGTVGAGRSGRPWIALGALDGDRAAPGSEQEGDDGEASMHGVLYSFVVRWRQ